MTRRRAIGSRTGEPSNESHKDKEGWSEMLLGAGSEPRSGKEKMSVLRVEGTLLFLEGRDGTVLFCVRGTWGGECFQGDGRNSFVREPVVDLLFLAVRALS